MVDSDKIFSAGHSSAGTLALLLAAHEPRLKGAIAYCPCGDVEKFHSELFESPGVAFLFPGIKGFVKKSSPITHLGKMTCPVFLFYSEGDSVVPIKDANVFIEAARTSGVTLDVKKGEFGGHYRSMIKHGIPAGIKWIQTPK